MEGTGFDLGILRCVYTAKGGSIFRSNHTQFPRGDLISLGLSTVARLDGGVYVNPTTIRVFFVVSTIAARSKKSSVALPAQVRF
ncbi:hypothetical protein GN244_ATG01030 [Phytophthora infestans]|uniref:Uncharacterized protein n=1 Tax=Phytophthora infestans TaxID=4787 RepID=A0A833W8H7_PHYIN|nr:hypothetical protein GN244_ATG01030 [Phytophthora infestans]KAF4130117.1 hypothetical protein GN958_ATG20532 [Phytophthora infestans]